MRHQFARFLLVLFLFQNTELGELLKLPLLVQHYRQHVQLHPGTTLGGFLKMHYLDKTVVDEDYAEDMQLPFKTLDNHNLVIQLCMPPAVMNIGHFHPFYLHQKAIYPSCYYPSVLKGKIFQPPKTV